MTDGPSFVSFMAGAETRAASTLTQDLNEVAATLRFAETYERMVDLHPRANRIANIRQSIIDLQSDMEEGII